MRVMSFIIVFAVFGLLSGEASAAEATVLPTTQDAVKKECAGKTKCSAPCGGTLCDYFCENPKKQCTVAIFSNGGGSSPVSSPVTNPTIRAPR
jgi:hypothetical protein